ncbi:MAG: hypothetical protein IPM60_14815 [Rhodospirillales bacterium]|nr:hypothetical protein [Rhodospirillales bacterium]
MLRLIPDSMARQMRSSFEAELTQRLSRASQVRLQDVIPAHWFAAAASECASMYIAGFFYGSISVAQSYVEALSKFLAETHAKTHNVSMGNNVEERWKRLHKKKVVSSAVCDAAVSMFADRNDFHHLNRQVEQDHRELEARARKCVNHLHTIESEVFAYSFDEPGKLTYHKPEYWPLCGRDMARVRLRQLW